MYRGGKLVVLGGMRPPRKAQQLETLSDLSVRVPWSSPEGSAKAPSLSRFWVPVTSFFQAPVVSRKSTSSTQYRCQTMNPVKVRAHLRARVLLARARMDIARTNHTQKRHIAIYVNVLSRSLNGRAADLIQYSRGHGDRNGQPGCGVYSPVPTY